MNNTFKLRSIVLGLLVIASTSISYSAEQNLDNGAFPHPHFHHGDTNNNIANDILPYRNFLTGISNRIDAVSFVSFMNNGVLSNIGSDITSRLNNLKHKVRLGINNRINKQSLSIWITIFINAFNSIKQNNQLSNEQEQVVDDILSICQDVRNRLNDNDNDTEYSDNDSDNDEENILN